MKVRLVVDAHGLSDVGRKRPKNEDQFLVAELHKSLSIRQTSLALEDGSRIDSGKRGYLFLVADGVGGAPAGGRASSLAVDTVLRYVLNVMPWFFRLEDTDQEILRRELKLALRKCQTIVKAEASARPERRGMATTLTLAYVMWPKLFVVHVGDSRCYVVRQGRLEQLTRDHTVANELLAQGVLKPAEARSSKWRHVIWNVVGTSDREFRPDVFQTDLRPGDALLLCTDGLIKHVSSEDLLRLMKRKERAAETCRALVDAANEGGGSDNTTVVVARFRVRAE